jgi:hypothetical protein
MSKKLLLERMRARLRASEVHWTFDYAVFTLHGLDGFGYYEVKHGLDMDLATLEWTLLGHLPFGFGLRSSSRLICTL